MNIGLDSGSYAKGRGESKKSKHNLRRILLEARHYWPSLIVCFVAIIIVNAATVAKPFILQIVVDDFLYAKNEEVGLYSIKGLALLYLFSIILATSFTYLQSVIINRVGQDVIMKLRRRVFSHIQLMPLTRLDKISAGRLITRATNDVEALSELFTDIIVNVVKDVFLLVGLVAAMIVMSPKLALISCIGIPFIAVITIIARRMLRKNFVRIKALIGQINGFFAENMAGMKIVQMFMKHREKFKEFSALNQQYFKASLVQLMINNFLRPLMEVINALVISALIWFAFDDIVSAVMLPGVLYAFTDYVKQFFNPINDLAEMYTNIQSASVSADRIYELLDNEDDLERLDEGDHVERFIGRIEFKNVWFAYNDENWVLKDVSFTIEPGQMVAFVGTTGSGKTTIISLLTRFYTIQKGQILVDGKDINTMKLSELRRNIAVVLQDVFLFAGTIKDNVRLDDDISDEEIEKALVTSQASRFIDTLPDGIDHAVVERGAAFSSGQRQLISFARAVVHDPAVFVLDEATAHIDTQTEQMIQQSLVNMAKDRTMIIIAHRLSTIRDCDCIFVMSRGRIRESGTHEELLALGGRYFNLHQAQSS